MENQVQVGRKNEVVRYSIDRMTGLGVQDEMMDLLKEQAQIDE